MGKYIPTFEHTINKYLSFVFANGPEIDEWAADLDVIAAIASSFRNLQIPPDTAVFGEVGLTGEVRGVLQAQSRAREAQTLGFKKLILPASNKKGLKNGLESELSASEIWKKR